MTILRNDPVDPTIQADQVVKGNGREDTKGMKNVMQVETTGFVSSWHSHFSLFTITSQVLLAEANRQNRLCLHFFYEVYDSPHPAAFRRVPDGGKEAAGPTEPQPPPLSPGRETIPVSLSSIHITVRSELQSGSTGIVHIGTMAVDQSGPTAKVAVKLAFSRDEKARLMEEHQVYSRLHSQGVKGIAHNIGLFVDEEPLLDAEGPYALVISYAGVSLFGRPKHLLDSVKQVVAKPISSLSVLITFAEDH